MLPNKPINFTNEVTFMESKANVQFYKIGKLIIINYQGEVKSHSQNEELFRLPSEYAPSQFVAVPFLGQNGAYSGCMGIYSNGAASIISITNSSKPGRLYANFTYVLG